MTMQLAAKPIHKFVFVASLAGTADSFMRLLKFFWRAPHIVCCIISYRNLLDLNVIHNARIP